jgi:hypothetical protein
VPAPSQHATPPVPLGVWQNLHDYAPRVQYGERRSFLEAEAGIDVISADGERVGALEHVLADDATSIFDGIVVDVRLGPGGHRFVDAPLVGDFFAQAVVLKLTAAEVDQLPEPSDNPAVIEHGGAEDSESRLAQKLRRAWDLITGRY